MHASSLLTVYTNTMTTYKNKIKWFFYNPPVKLIREKELEKLQPDDLTLSVVVGEKLSPNISFGVMFDSSNPTKVATREALSLQ